jgi:hypothetical protein
MRGTRRRNGMAEPWKEGENGSVDEEEGSDRVDPNEAVGTRRQTCGIARSRHATEGIHWWGSCRDLGRHTASRTWWGGGVWFLVGKVCGEVRL